MFNPQPSNEMSGLGPNNHLPHIWENKKRKDYAIQSFVKDHGYVYSWQPKDLKQNVRSIVYMTNNVNEILGRNLRLTTSIASKLGIPEDNKPVHPPIHFEEEGTKDGKGFTDTQKTELETEFKKNLTEIKKTLEEDRESIRKAILAVRDQYSEQLGGVKQDLDRIINLINEQEDKDALSNLEKQIKPLLDLEQKSKKGVNSKLDELSRQLASLSHGIDNNKPKEIDHSGDLEEIKSLLKKQPKPEKQKDYSQEFKILQELIKANKHDNKQQFDDIMEKLNQLEEEFK